MKRNRVINRIFRGFLFALSVFASINLSELQAEAEPKYSEKKFVYFDSKWAYATYCVSYSDPAILYMAKDKRKNIVVAVDAGHGTDAPKGAKTYCHPDKSPKTTGGSTKKGELMAFASGTGMSFRDGTTEGEITLAEAKIFRDRLLENGYDVLMIRETPKTKIDMIARTLLANNYADCHISIHWDGDGYDYDKGAFYIAVPDGIKEMYPVSTVWKMDNLLGECLISGLRTVDTKIYKNGRIKIDLTQTSYSTIPSVDIEMGNQCSDHSDSTLEKLAEGLLTGVDYFFFG